MTHRNPFKGSSPSQSRTSKSGSIRGKISAPIPFPDPLDDTYTGSPLQSSTGPAMPISPTSLPPHAITISEGQPISMPIVPNSTLAHAVSTDTPIPPSAMNSIPSAPSNAANTTTTTNINTSAAPSSSTSPSPVPPIDIAPITQNFTISRGPLTAPLPSSTTTTTSSPHTRSFSHSHSHFNTNTNAPVIPPRSTNRTKPPLSHAMVRTSAALSVGTDRSVNTETSTGAQTAESVRSRAVTEGENDGVPARKKSTLRAVVGKIFGKKRRKHGVKPSQAGISELVDGVRKHTTQESMQPRSIPISAPLLSSKRSISLPPHERTPDLDRDRALRSHSIGPRDIVAIESARNSLNLESPLQTQLAVQMKRHQASQDQALFDGVPASPMSWGKRRAASMGGDLFRGAGGLSPRPTSSQGRSRTPREEHEASGLGEEVVSEEMIGQAVSTSPGEIKNRRRSRSVPGISLDLSQVDSGRRRSDEIRYWRASYGGVLVQSPTTDGGPMTGDDPDLSGPASRSGSPAKPFNFDLPMKITEAATLESRLSSLESRVNRLEKSSCAIDTSRLGTGTTITERDRIISGAPTLLNGSAVQLTETLRPPSSRRSEESHMSFGQAPTFVGSLHAAPAAAAVRAKLGPVSQEEYGYLLHLLEQERSARESLEAEVRWLARVLAGGAMRNFSLRNPAGRSLKEEEDKQNMGQGEGQNVEEGEGDEEEGEGEVTVVPEVEVTGAFGEDLRDSGRKAARTLSLSQLTQNRVEVSGKAI